MSVQICRACQQKHAQEYGLCRSCSRAAGYFLTTREMEADRIGRATMKLVALRVPDALLLPRDPIQKRVRGREYEVVWDGA